jgi:hypothetical protein
MDLLSSTSEQVEALIQWMFEQAELKAPGPSEHAERCLAMKEHAWFLKEIVHPKIVVGSRMTTLAVAEGVNALPTRPDGLRRNGDFLQGKSQASDLEVKVPDPAEGTRIIIDHSIDRGAVDTIPGATV